MHLTKGKVSLKESQKARPKVVKVKVELPKEKGSPVANMERVPAVLVQVCLPWFVSTVVRQVITRRIVDQHQTTATTKAKAKVTKVLKAKANM